MLPADVVTHLDEHVDALRDAHGELRWVPASRWHLTLEFLGDCGRHEQERQRGRWTVRARRVAPLQLAVAGGGAYPKSWRARVLWAGVDVDRDGWRRLAGHDQEAHVTLARSRDLADATGLVDALTDYRGPGFVATEVALVESHLRHSGDHGPRYEVLDTFPLGR